MIKKFKRGNKLYNIIEYLKLKIIKYFSWKKNKESLYSYIHFTILFLLIFYNWSIFLYFEKSHSECFLNSPNTLNNLIYLLSSSNPMFSNIEQWRAF